jgi:hypothetical protein
MSDARADGGANRSHGAVIGCFIFRIRTDVDLIGRRHIRETSNWTCFTYLPYTISRSSYHNALTGLSSGG